MKEGKHYYFGLSDVRLHERVVVLPPCGDQTLRQKEDLKRWQSMLQIILYHISFKLLSINIA